MKRTSEEAFERAIERTLLSNGYITPESAFDPEKAIFPEEALAFVRKTQPETWKKLEAVHKGQTDKRVLESLCKWMDEHGVLNTLRHGFRHHGKELRIAYFRPAHGLNPELQALYDANQLGVTRQLHYSAKSAKSLDVTLSLNGIPLVTLELKNPLTGQTAEDAQRQYVRDRDPREPIFAFAKRTLVHFAVDTEVVFMTTKLAGVNTRFLPFNRGDEGGAGNAPDGRNYKTAYLWEEVLARDSLMDLLARFLHLESKAQTDETGGRTKVESLIFPRYHQLTAVRQLEEQAREEGPGHSYLVEHSAGSGKSNTIAWLAYRLSSLHNEQDERLFHSVVVVTDRIVLDRQLQDTIYQFEHRHGVVQKIDDDSKQLAQALEDKASIIITTLQKFPFVTRHLHGGDASKSKKPGLPTYRYAVIVDEAHSSQAGETSMELRSVLGGGQLLREAKKMAKDEGEVDLERLFISMARRGQQPNMSFFAFTATPKHKTLKIFGRDGEPSHRYTMRQAIQERFIMDVLQSYISYKAYYKLLKSAASDPNVERKPAAKALARFFRLHPSNIAQRVEVMVEHFQLHTRHRINGFAKAMVVTGSRLEAVRYKQEFDRCIQEKGYGIKSLVAFSGVVEDDKIPGKTYTEVEMNGGVREKELPETFAQPEHRVLLVAEKYQTGFDQPLLHTMYINKRISGIQAVQTLSRLNRVHPGKEDTFVLDFVNDTEEIREAFAQYYEGSELGQEVDPGRLDSLRAELNASGIYHQEEMLEFCTVFFAPKDRHTPSDHKRMNAILDKAVARFAGLNKRAEEEAEVWRGKSQAFRNLYSFLSQVLPYQDSQLERLFTYLRYLATKLPSRDPGPDYQFDDKVGLDSYRLRKISDGAIQLEGTEGSPLDGQTELGTQAVREGDEIPLSQLIDEINQRFGSDLTKADQLLFGQLAQAACQDEGMQQAAQANPLDKFMLAFAPRLKTLFVQRMGENEKLHDEYLQNDELQQLVSDWLGRDVYQRLQSQGDRV